MANEPVTPEPRVYHLSHPSNRASILAHGLLPRVGRYIQEFVGSDLNIEPAVYATNSDNENYWFETADDDDIWEITTENLSNTWYVDAHFPEEENQYQMVTFEPVPARHLRLLHEGTGKPRGEENDDFDEE